MISVAMVKGEKMDELISRQAAIDAMEEYFARIGKLKRRGLNKGEKAIALDTVGAIKSLPSTQPEIIYCKDCKHHWTHKCMDSMPIERCDLEQTFYDAEHDFCSLAERREDG